MQRSSGLLGIFVQLFLEWPVQIDPPVLWIGPPWIELEAKEVWLLQVHSSTNIVHTVSTWKCQNKSITSVGRFLLLLSIGREGRVINRIQLFEDPNITFYKWFPPRIVFCCIAARIQPNISGCQQDFLVFWRWNQLRTF